MRFLTAGESHGKGLTVILEGVPAGLYLNETKIAEELTRRRRFYGRSERMQIEDDNAEVLSGVRNGITTGAPIAFFIKNRDNRLESTNDSQTLAAITKPRAGHADYAGMIKYNISDARDIAERASGRETAARTVIGAVSKLILAELSIVVHSHVTNVGGIVSDFSYYNSFNNKDIDSVFTDKDNINSTVYNPFINKNEINSGFINKDINSIADKDKLRCLDKAVSSKMAEFIDKARDAGDTVGGESELILTGLPAGFGSCAMFDTRLDYKIAGMLMSIPSVKGIQIGNKNVFCGLGSEAADPIVVSDGKIIRPKNYGGGIEGGISNGSDIVVTVTVKPPPTMKMGADTIDFNSGEPARSHYERSDICVVSAISVVSENCLAYVIAETVLSGLGGDTMIEVKERYLAKKEKGDIFNKDRK